MVAYFEIFVFNGAVHAFFALVFAGFSLWAKQPRRYSVATSAMFVALITAGVSVLLAAGAGTFVHAVDGRTMYLAEWLGYTLSLYFIGHSLAETLAPNASDAVHVHAGQALALVGAGGVAGLFIESSDLAAHWLLVLLIFVPYIFFAALITVSRNADRTVARGEAVHWLLVVFMVVTLVAYVGPYMLGDVMHTTSSVLGMDLERWFYLGGNLLTKIVLPSYEIYLTG